MVSRNQILKNFLSLGTVQLLNAGLQLAVIPRVVQRIGLEQFGVVAVAQVLVFYLATLTDFGFNQTGTREVSVANGSKEKINHLFWNITTIKLLLCLAGFLIMLIIILTVPVVQEHTALYLLAFVFVPGYAAQPVWLLQGLEKMQWLALSNLAARVLFVALVFLFINEPGDASLYLLFYGLGNLAAGLFSTGLLIRKLGLQLQVPSLPDIRKELRDGWMLTVTALSMNVAQYGNIFLLRLFTNDLTAGYFGIAERIYFTMKQMLQAFSQTVYPGICRAATGDAAGLRNWNRKIFLPFLIPVLLAALVIAWQAPLLIQLFAGEAHEGSVTLLRLFTAIIVITYSGLAPSLSLLALDKRMIYARIYIVAVLLNILVNLLLVPRFAAYGSITAVGITELFVAVSCWLVLQQFLKKMSSRGSPAIN